MGLVEEDCCGVDEEVWEEEEALPSPLDWLMTYVVSSRSQA